MTKITLSGSPFLGVIQKSQQHKLLLFFYKLVKNPKLLPSENDDALTGKTENTIN